MDPRKLSIGGESPSRGSGRHETTPSSSNIITPSFSPQPSLPSIRQLHPYLPPSGLSQHLPQPGEGSGAMPMYPPHLVSQPGPSSQTVLGPRRSSEMFSMESEPEVGEESPEPPKKKRRRQALSCTDSNRAPLALAEESNQDVSGISWSPEKYVTRAEFDDLKARYDELFEQVQRLQAATPVPSYYHMGITPGGLPGTSSEAVPPIVPLGYQPMIPPSQSYNLSTPSQGHQRFIKPEDTQTQSRHHQVPDINGSKGVSIFSCLYYNPVQTRLAVKKLPRADARAGAASASQGPVPRQPSDSNPPPAAGTSPEAHLQPSRRLLDSPFHSTALSRDDERETLAHFPRNR
ncbi:hypothetical protein H0H93_007325 [Arthromyces matolae]|nr:hypothetical protein H0H93_007325 [Arthromyces matolae]